MSRVIVFGSGGQLGRELALTTPSDVSFKGISHGECDITKARDVSDAIEQFRPDVVINTAAYTSVDRAESDRATAFAVNAAGAGNLAEAAKHGGARIVHVSTDYVFGGASSRPYRVTDLPDPIGVYGESKAEGERAVLASGAEALVIRTSWLYSSHGRNFLTTMLRLMRTGAPLRVADDQTGVPTAARDLAVAIWEFVKIPEARGILHWTNSGIASWYDFAVAIQELALSKGVLTNASEIVPISTSELQLPARRPAYSVLDSTAGWQLIGRDADHWRAALARTIDEVRNVA